MRSKLNYLIGVSLKRKIKTKWFMAANILLAVAIIAVINIDSIINFFGGDFNEKTNVYIVDKTDYSYSLFEQQLIAANKALYGEASELYYELTKSDKSVDELKEMIKTNDEESDSIILEFTSSLTSPLEVTMITKDYLDYMDTGVLNTALNNTKVSLALMNSSISAEELEQIYSEVPINRIYLSDNKNSEEENMSMIMTTVFPILILPIFMLTIFLVQMVGAEVNDEKTTRGMEIIISNVSPKTHFFSKIIAANLFVLIQGVLLVLFAAIGLWIRKMLGGSSITGGIGAEVTGMLDVFMSSNIGKSLVYIVPLAIILIVFTFIAYGALAAILASMTTNTEDFQQLQTPIMIISLVGYYLSIMAGVFEGATFIKVLSYVPFISAILSPSLLVLGQIGVVDVIISIVLIILTNYILIKYGLRIYKVGILNYSSKDLWKKMFKALKN